MAKIGLKKLLWSKFATEPDSAAPTYEASKTIGKMVSLNLSWTRASGEFYADDEVAESVDDVISGNATIEVDHLSLEDQAAMNGSTYDSSSGELIETNTDTPPFGGIGGYQVLLKNGVKIYRAYFLPKVKASVPDDTGNTKTASPSFGTQTVNLAVQFANDGHIRYRKDFETENAALAWVSGKFTTA